MFANTKNGNEHREWKEKFDLFDNDEEDTLKYHYKNYFKFRPDLSGPGLTGNEIITIPHPCMNDSGYSFITIQFFVQNSFLE